jgi:hypothetical protein
MSPRINSTLIDEPGSILLELLPTWRSRRHRPDRRKAKRAKEIGANCRNAAGVAPEINNGVWIRVNEGAPAAAALERARTQRDCGSNN